MQSFLLVALTLANGVVGFLLQVLVAKLFGVGLKSDAYFRALAAPLFCVGLFMAQSTFSAVPALMSRGLTGAAEWLSAARSYMLTSTTLGLVVAIVGSLLWPPGLLWPRVGWEEGGGLALGVACWIYGATQFALVATVALLQSKHRYPLALMVMGIPQVFVCLAMLLLPRLELVTIPLLQTSASAACTLAASVALLRSKPEGGKAPEGRPGFGLRILLESPYAVATLACFSVYAVIDSALLPLFGSGFLTSASFCQRLVIGFGQLVIAAPLTLVTRDLVASVDRRDPAGFRKSLLTSLATVVRHSVSLALVLYLAADWIMYLALTSRNKDSLDSAIAARTLRQMLPGMVFMLLGNMLARSALTVPGLVRKTWWVGLVWAALYGVSVILISSPQFNGSGYSYSIAWGATSILFGYFLSRHGPSMIEGTKGARAAVVAE
jgi:putative peptidoglycan lipid II flippase